MVLLPYDLTDRETGAVIGTKTDDLHTPFQMPFTLEDWLSMRTIAQRGTMITPAELDANIKRICSLTHDGRRLVTVAHDDYEF